MKIIALIICIILPCTLFAQEISYHSQGSNGVVAASDPPTIQAGLDMLAKGGNAADASVAVILAETVTDFPRFGAGGEVIYMYYDVKSQKVKVLSGLGEAPLSREGIDWYMKNGIPSSNIKAALVPSVIDLCVKALQLYGTLSFGETVMPAIKLLESGKEVSMEISKDLIWYPDLAKTYKKLIEAEMNTKGDRIQKLQAVADRFYRGDIADSLDAWYKRVGAFFTKEDLAKHVTEVEDPITIEYRGYSVYKTNTWTQGPVMLETLRLIDNFDIAKFVYLSPEYIHIVTEALKLSLADRDTYYGDPLFVNVPLKNLISKQYAKLRYPLIDLNKASDECRPGDPINMKALLENGGKYLNVEGGTTTCSVIDKWGNMVAASPSGWGSNAGAGGSTGVTHGTRLKSFNTLKGHPNCIEPGKRPRVTLSPTIVLKNGKPVMAMSIEGGDTQEQNSVNLFHAILVYGMKPYDAVTLPRFTTNQYQDSFNPSSDRNKAYPSNRLLIVREGISIDCWNSLKKLGHSISLAKDGDKVAIGHPSIVYLDQKSGVAFGATDPSTARFTGALK